MKNFLRNVSLLCFAAAAAHAADTTFWIEPCTVMLAGCDAGDADLARWALEAWAKASDGQLHFAEVKERKNALLRVLVGRQKQRTLRRSRARQRQRPPRLRVAHPDRRAARQRPPAARHHRLSHLPARIRTRARTAATPTSSPISCTASSTAATSTSTSAATAARLMARDDIRKYSGMSPADRDALLKSIPKGVPR